MKRVALALGGVAAVLFFPGAAVYYNYSGGGACARCHEIRPAQDMWLASSHRSVACAACHGGALTADPRFHAGNLRRVLAHVRGRVPERIRLRAADAAAMTERCGACHRQEHAQWKAGPHGATYARLFLDKEHNGRQLLIDDCLRCHGAHFEGGIGELVDPVDTRGPWRLVRPELAQAPAIPCLACHQVHRRGEPLARPAARRPGPAQEIARPSLAFYDRRQSGSYGAAMLPLPLLLQDTRAVRMSPDARQALCYQCHAPLAGAQAGSGDDRTPLGVHEGLSCLACHQKHGQETRASCAGCHPRLSNCGLDVERMDTTFRDPESRHDVHFVRCEDCHPKGVPLRP